MEPIRPAEAPSPTPETLEFVRFCYRRRRVGWPELYDEMCAVAGRGLYRGWRFAELESHGIGFSLDQTLELARLAGQVAQEEGDRRGRVTATTAMGAVAGSDGARPIAIVGSAPALPTAVQARDEEGSFDVRIVSATPAREPVEPPAPAAAHEAIVADPADQAAPSRVAVPMDAPAPGRLGSPPAGPTLVPSLVTSGAIAG